MPYRWFVFILVASSAATLALGVWKAVALTRPADPLVDRWPTFIEKLSWFAVPWPLFLGIAYLGWPWIWLRLLWAN